MVPTVFTTYVGKHVESLKLESKLVHFTYVLKIFPADVHIAILAPYSRETRSKLIILAENRRNSS